MTSVPGNGTSPLRVALDDAAAETGLPLKDLTVLAVQNDPFRIDTEARHRDGEWLAITIRDLGLGDRTIHLRGLHYALIGRAKPDGTPYANNEADWLWLSGDAAKAARWLGYLAFDRVTDARNTPPVIRVHSHTEPESYVTVGLDVQIPDADDLIPVVRVTNFEGIQRYKLVLFGEKSSLEPVLGQVAASYRADLYLPSGEISDTMLYTMARTGAEDGRPMVVFCFSDCDPAGWQMPISIGRKLQAFKALEFRALTFEVRRVALTPDLVREHRLPSTPLKATERRGDRWRSEMGVEQTEIDALASLQPRLLSRLAREAIAPFFDRTLAERVSEARQEWLSNAQAVVDAALDSEHLERLRVHAAEQLAAMRDEIDAINDALRVDPDDFDIPPPVIPHARLDGDHGHDDGEDHPKPLLDSRWSFADQTAALKQSKAYGGGGS